MDSAIINYLKKENQINIGDKMAEDIKVAIASAYEDDEEGVYEVRVVTLRQACRKRHKSRKAKSEPL